MFGEQTVAQVPPNIVHFCYVYELFFADDYLVYYKHYHNIAVSCTKNEIKHDKTKTNNNKKSPQKGVGSIPFRLSLSLHKV